MLVLWNFWVLIFLSFSQDTEAVTVLEFGDKPGENAKLDVNIELPTSSFSLCFQMYLMQHTQGFVPSQFGENEDTILFYFRTKDFNLPSWLVLFGRIYSFLINEDILELYHWTGVCLSESDRKLNVFMRGLQVGQMQRLDTIQTNTTILNTLKFDSSTKVCFKS